MQGFSLGGEVGPTTAYLMEATAVGRRGLAVSCQPASQLIAATAGALVGVVLSEVMTSEALATRYDKTDQRFKGMINLAATAIALK